MTKQLWAPWRLEYIKQADEREGCFFCVAAEGPDEEGLVVHRGERAFVAPEQISLLVRPSAGGAVQAHRRLLASSTTTRRSRSTASPPRGLGALAAVYEPQGYNLGWNLGRIAGAGVIDHVHEHVVPRWAGDTNFMPVLADVKVLPEHLAETRERLAAAWPL